MKMVFCTICLVATLAMVGCEKKLEPATVAPADASAVVVEPAPAAILPPVDGTLPQATDTH